MRNVEPLYGLRCQESARSLSRLFSAFLTLFFCGEHALALFHAWDRVRGANGCRRVDPRSKQLLIAQAFLSISCVRSGLATSVTHSNPYLTVGLDRREASRDCDTNESIACHAVETHRCPGHRPFIPGVLPAISAGSSVSLGLGPGAITPL